MSTTAPSRVVTPQSMIRTWIREWARDRDVIDNEDMLDAARSRFEDDTVFHDALVAYALDEMVAAEARDVFRSLRLITMGDQAMTRGAFDSHADDRWSRWKRRYESVEAGRRLMILHMTKADLIATADAREQRGNGELVQAWFLRGLAKGMATGQIVQDVYTPDELDSIHESARKRMMGGVV